MPSLLRRLPLLAGFLTTVALLAGGLPSNAQTKPAPTRPAPARPAPQSKPPAPPAKAPEPVKPPPPPPPQDVRMRTTYMNGAVKTEGVTYIKGERERFEFQDMVLLKQHDLKRTIQYSKAANTYLVIADGMPATPGVPAAAPRPPGVVTVATTIVDTMERKPMFGREARHVKTAIDRQPMPGACDTARQRIETDGWYIDTPGALSTPGSAASEQAPADATGGCLDQIQATTNGDPRVLGFPVAYTTTITGEDGRPVVASMEVAELEQTALDPALFEAPSGATAALNVRDLSKALSDATEVKLAASDAAPPSAPMPKAPGVVRIGVPEFTNKTTLTVDTRALRQRLVANLTEGTVEAVPMAAAAPAELQQRASELGYDYVLFAEVTDLKVSKPGGFGGLLKAASGAAGGRSGAAGAAGAAAAPKENTESSVAVKLVQPDGKQRLSTTSKGKDGSGFNLKTGLGLAKFAGGMYLSTMLAGPQMLARLNGMGAGNLGGMGVLGNPALYQMQSGGLSGLGRGAGIDATAGAASYLLQQTLTMNDLGGLVGVPGQGPSFDDSLGEALENAAKTVQKAVQKQ